VISYIKIRHAGWTYQEESEMIVDLLDLALALPEGVLD
jgi:hypothetical protein